MHVVMEVVLGRETLRIPPPRDAAPDIASGRSCALYAAFHVPLASCSGRPLSISATAFGHAFLVGASIRVEKCLAATLPG